MKNIFFLLMLIMCVFLIGCNISSDNTFMPASPSAPNLPSTTPTPIPTSPTIPIQEFFPEDVVVTPNILFYDFDTARENGVYHEIYGELPGASLGTWYTIRIDGIEYYYGLYDYSETSSPKLFGFSIIDKKYSLANGISVGMTIDEVLNLYPNILAIDFENNYINAEGKLFVGWNSVSYPRSSLNLDIGYEYDGSDYQWTNQFDFLMIADILQKSDSIPVYLGLLVKSNCVVAITFYHPTAG